MDGLGRTNILQDSEIMVHVQNVAVACVSDMSNMLLSNILNTQNVLRMSIKKLTPGKIFKKKLKRVCFPRFCPETSIIADYDVGIVYNHCKYLRVNIMIPTQIAQIR